MITDREISTLAHSLMIQHGLIAKGWTFKINNNKSRLGVCKRSSNGLKQIEVSRVLINASGDRTVLRDVLLHELAHALLPSHHGHDYVWKAKAREIGANPSRVYEGELDKTKVDYKYTGTCPKCDKDYGFSRCLKRSIACTDCCNKYSYGRYDVRFKLNIKQNY
jgi:hypothetical protein